VNPLPTTVSNSLAAADFDCWCGAGTWFCRFRTRRFGLLRCSACGSYRIDPPPVRSSSESQNFYTDYYSKVQTHAQVSWFRTVAARVPELAHPGEIVADIGCGDGNLCAELRALGWKRSLGLEVSRTRVARARLKYPDLEFYDCPLGMTGLSEQTLDLAVLDSVIEHLPEPVSVLTEIRSYIKPRGLLLLLTPNMESGHFRFLGRRWTGMLAPHAHIFLFAAESLGRLLRNAGFTVTHSGSVHAPVCALSEWFRRLASGDVKGAVWRAHQEMGGLYGRWIGCGPMLYVVATRCET
jgi:2-polyprenyl-3-methyl-5-hydroxy-6-metoxy-1,4-benzoquinol methylase